MSNKSLKKKKRKAKKIIKKIKGYFAADLRNARNFRVSKPKSKLP